MHQHLRPRPARGQPRRRRRHRSRRTAPRGGPHPPLRRRPLCRASLASRCRSVPTPRSLDLHLCFLTCTLVSFVSGALLTLIPGNVEASPALLLVFGIQVPVSSVQNSSLKCGFRFAWLASFNVLEFELVSQGCSRYASFEPVHSLLVDPCLQTAVREPPSNICASFLPQPTIRSPIHASLELKSELLFCKSFYEQLMGE